MAPLKRHNSLRHLSREHHRILIIARWLRKDAPAFRNMPVEHDEKVLYMQNQGTALLCTHFEKEEKLLFPFVYGFNNWIDQVIQELKTDHEIILNLCSKLMLGSQTEISLDELGVLLENHIRKEERLFFEAIQRAFDERVLDDLDMIMKKS
jgi:iron-sulfur cluster repair protein YtfE (RIC family)